MTINDNFNQLKWHKENVKCQGSPNCKLCEEYDFEIIWPGENLGICGGRQFIAEHFDKSEYDYYYRAS